MVDREDHLDSILGHQALRISQARVVDQRMQGFSGGQELRRCSSNLSLRSEISLDEMNVLASGLATNLGHGFISPHFVPVGQEQLCSHPGQLHGSDASDPVRGAGYQAGLALKQPLALAQGFPVATVVSWPDPPGQSATAALGLTISGAGANHFHG